MVDSTLSRALDKQFLSKCTVVMEIVVMDTTDSKRLRNVNQKLAGAIVLSLSSDSKLTGFPHPFSCVCMCVQMYCTSPGGIRLRACVLGSWQQLTKTQL